MLYAKIDKTNNTIIEFPYRELLSNLQLQMAITQQTQSLPDDAVEVNVQTPSNLSWDQTSKITTIEFLNNAWVANLEVVEKYASNEEKLKAITQLVKDSGTMNLNTLNSKIKELQSTYSITEISSWSTQLSEAQAYQANNSAVVPMLLSIAIARGESVADLATKIVNKANAYNTSYGQILGTYQKNYAVLNSIILSDSTTWNNINSYSWN